MLAMSIFLQLFSDKPVVYDKLKCCPNGGA